MAIITVSRGTYSGGKNLAESLSQKLGYRSLSREEREQLKTILDRLRRKTFEELIVKPFYP